MAPFCTRKGSSSYGKDNDQTELPPHHPHQTHAHTLAHTVGAAQVPIGKEQRGRRALDTRSRQRLSRTQLRKQRTEDVRCRCWFRGRCRHRGEGGGEEEEEEEEEKDVCCLRLLQRHEVVHTAVFRVLLAFVGRTFKADCAGGGCCRYRYSLVQRAHRLTLWGYCRIFGPSGDRSSPSAVWKSPARGVNTIRGCMCTGRIRLVVNE